jgi:hypothetical protein
MRGNAVRLPQVCNDGVSTVRNLIPVLLTAAALSAASLAPASAMPVSNLAAARDGASVVQNVDWVCARHRCWWRGWTYGPVDVVRGVPYCYGAVGYGACGVVGSPNPYWLGW